MSKTTFNLEDTIAYEQRVLLLKRFAAMSSLGRTTLDSMNISASESPLFEGMLLKIEADMLTDKIAEDEYKASYSYKVYTSPWQFFKARYMPKWFVKLRPVKRDTKHGNVTVKLTRLATYPKANVALQRDKRFFEITLGGVEYIRDEVEQL